MSAIIPKALKCSLMTQQNQSYTAKYISGKFNFTLTVEIPEENLRIPLQLPHLAKNFQTSNWLVQQVKTLIMNSPAIQNISAEQLTSLVGLRTKNADLHMDYLLSIPEQKLNFLRDYITLIPVFYQDSPSSKMTEPRVTLDDFKIIAKIGEGGFSKVYLVQMKANNRFYALKQICKFRANGEPITTDLLEERNILASLEGEQHVKLHFAFQTQQFCYLVLDFVPGGDLASLKHKVNKFQEDEAKFFVAQIILALNELHRENIIYRDLKPENLLLDLDGYIKLCDFGLSVRFGDSTPAVHTICGTSHFMSPEMLSRKGYDSRTDYFSLGVVVYEMVTGALPFSHADRKQVFYSIMHKEPKYTNEISNDLKDFISGLLKKLPEDRLGSSGGAEEILAHPWLRNFDLQSVKNRKVKLSLPLQPITKILRPYTEKLDIEDAFLKHRLHLSNINKSVIFKFYSFRTEDPVLLSSKKYRQKGSDAKSTYFEDDAEIQTEKTDYDEYLDETCAAKQLVAESLVKCKIPDTSRSKNEIYSDVFYDFEEIIQFPSKINDTITCII